MYRKKTVTAPIAYLKASDSQPQVKVYPPSSGMPAEVPEIIYREMSIEDARSWSVLPALAIHGVELCRHKTEFTEFYNAELVRKVYYPEVIDVMKTFTGAIEVFAFDHNTRSAVRAAQGQHGVRTPVDGAHVDYTSTSGPKRTLEILEDNGRMDLSGNRASLINLWRPITGPVYDNPLALCDVQTVEDKDLAVTEILHYLEGDLDHPGHTGQIYSIYYNPNHRWLYFSEMQENEVILLKCYDSQYAGVNSFTPHTGFKNPDCPVEFIPRESIEVRTLVIYPEPD